MSKLFGEFKLGDLTLKNRVVMAPMTRSRAIDNLANDLMKTYYEQRSEAGLIITEGVSPSPNGLGYPRIPGIFNEAQRDSWKQVTEAVHAQGSKIFLQIMHTGRVSHEANLPEGGKVIAPSAIPAPEPFNKMYVDGKGMLEVSQPKEMTTEEVKATIQEFVATAKLAVEAGFDGVELHAANGYLPNQFLNPKSNQRTDEYGGSNENRNRFVLEMAKAAVEAIGASKVGIRISPYGVFNGMGEFDGIDEQYAQLAEELGKIGLVYIHLADMSAMTQVPVPSEIKETIQSKFGGTIILNGSYNAEKANADIEAGKAELVAFGVPFIANPDLVTRMKDGIGLAMPNQDTFYTPGAEGYTDYPKA